MSKDDDAIRAGLTPEELAALDEPDDSNKNATQEELEALAAAAGETKAEVKDEKANTPAPGADDGAAPAGDKPAAAAAPVDGAVPTEAPTAEPSAAPQPAQQAPLFVAKAPEDADAKLADIATKKSDLVSKFDDGEITAKQYQTEIDTLGKQEREIELAVATARIASDMEAQRQKNQWDNDCSTFIDANKAVYAGEANKEAFAHLNETIIAFARMPRNANLSGPELLDKAHKAVMAERGTPVTAAAPAPAARKEIPKPTLPPDLGTVPSAASNDPGEGKYASLDKLQASDTLAYEAALSKLSAAEQDAYLRA